ncbi:MAG: pyruvate dehydrogenase (acetyl-transferring) E1 component subunit alpha, partial [Saprospiraceae bacterium]|nr:pyruvate dehydrogenase (acetyl-transferring) E1 component subunit alpha [Saprospiraceae bacterium]
MVASKKKKATGGMEHPKDRYMYWYELMLRIRRFEERALVMYGQQKIRGCCPVYTGQEAVAAGIAPA